MKAYGVHSLYTLKDPRNRVKILKQNNKERKQIKYIIKYLNDKESNRKNERSEALPMLTLSTG